MFLDWAAHLQLLQHDPAQNILKDFTLAVKRIMVSQVVTFLLEGTNFKTLTNPSHVIYAMETCGQGFALPIEEEESITKVINLYKQWSLEKGKRPTAIDDDLQFFIQRMLSHYSLLFEARAQTKEMVEKHASLCSRVLEIFAQIGRVVGPKMSEETWELFLKLLISITDSILRPDAAASQEPLQRKLCPQLLKVLFELWLHSHTTNPYLWNALKQRLQSWTHHMSLITTWRAACIGLTKRVNSILYGPSEGTENVCIQFDDQLLSLQLDDVYVVYSWHRWLNIVGNPNLKIANPSIFLAFISGVEVLVNLFLKIASTRKEPSRYIPPTGNTILHIFGSWLFDAVHLDRIGFDEGSALSLKIISAIFAAKYKTNIDPIYISSYYSCLQVSLSKEGRVLLAAITSSTTLFTYEIKGIRCLVPYFVGGIQRILSKRAGGIEGVMSIEQVRKAALTLFSTLLCLPNHFSDTPFALRAKDKLSKIYDADNYSALKKLYTMILTEALSNETCPSNIETLLNLTHIWQAEDIDFSSEFTKNSISLITRKITGQGGWPNEVSLFAINTLCSMSNLYPKIENGREQANLIVIHLSKHLSSLLSSPPDRLVEDIIIQLYKCITDWMMADQWILSFPDTKDLLLKTIVMGLRGSSNILSDSQRDIDPKKLKKSKKEEKIEKKDIAPSVLVRHNRIKDIAHTTLCHLLNHLGNFPTASGASVISTLAREEEILYQQCIQGNFNLSDSKEYIRYFITDDKVILCVIDRPFDDKGPHSCIIIRDKTGRYAWDTFHTHLPYSKLKPTEGQIEAHHSGSTDLPICCTPIQSHSSIPDHQLSDILSYLQSQTSQSAFKLVEHQLIAELKLLKGKNFNLDENIIIQVPAPADPYIGDCKFQKSRILLSQLGFLSLENRDKIYPLQMNEQFFSSLKALDGSAERECIKTAVMFIRKGQSEDEYLGNEGGTLDYQEFIASLGWGVKVAEHRGYIGSLESQFCTVAPYWSNYSTEICFHVTTLMANSPSYPDHQHKKRQIMGALVVVIWAEDYQDFQAGTMWARCRHNLIFVLITPLDSGLYFVKLLSKNELEGVGPLLDGVVVSKAILGSLVRETSISAYRREHNEAETPHQIRCVQIDNIYSLFKRDTSLEKFYTSIFTSLSADQCGPTPIDRVPITPPPVINPNAQYNSNGNVNGNLNGNSGNIRSEAPSTPTRERGGWGKAPPARDKKDGWINTGNRNHPSHTRTPSTGNLTLADQRDSKKSDENESNPDDDSQKEHPKDHKDHKEKDKDREKKKGLIRTIRQKKRRDSQPHADDSDSHEF